MNSITAYTEEIDDLNGAAEALFSQVEGFRLQKNSLAILFAEEDTDYPRLYALLSKKWKFPIIGCTATGMLLGREGFCGIGVSVMILTADDCTFSAGMTEQLDMDNYQSEIERVYRELSAAHETEIKLILSYGAMVTGDNYPSGDDLVDTLTAAAGGNVPVYGGAASDGFSFDNFQVYCNDRALHRGQAVALISGKVSPRFACINSVENKASFVYKVTKSRTNLVYRLGERTFVDALKKAGMEVEKSDVVRDYILSPFMVSIHWKDGDSVEVARNLSMLNHETGAGLFLGLIPEGSILSVGVLNRGDVQRSVSEAFDRIFKDLMESGNEYHTLLCNSCCSRFLALVGNASAEAETYHGRVPPGVSLMGYYAFGEYCPVRGDKTGKDYNMFHNFSFTVLAL